MKLRNLVERLSEATEGKNNIDSIVYLAYCFARLVYVLYSLKILSQKDIDYILVEKI